MLTPAARIHVSLTGITQVLTERHQLLEVKRLVVRRVADGVTATVTTQLISFQSTELFLCFDKFRWRPSELRP